MDLPTEGMGGRMRIWFLCSILLVTTVGCGGTAASDDGSQGSDLGDSQTPPRGRRSSSRGSRRDFTRAGSVSQSRMQQVPLEHTGVTGFVPTIWLAGRAPENSRLVPPA